MAESLDDLGRSDLTRAIAEQALIQLLHKLGPDAPPIVLLGGLVPSLLTSGQSPAVPRHLGTTDVDVLLITHIEEANEPGLEKVEKALIDLDFQNVQDGWRWRGPIGSVNVKIEFLCDVDDYANGFFIQPDGCRELAALNTRGTRYVAIDYQDHLLTGKDEDGSAVTVNVRAAGLGGYLLAKACALRDRALAKDYYDFAYVLLHNGAGGPAAAARLIKEGPLSAELAALRPVFVEIRDRYGRTRDDGPMRFAEESQKVESTLDFDRARADAVAAVSVFVESLELGV